MSMSVFIGTNTIPFARGILEWYFSAGRKNAKMMENAHCRLSLKRKQRCFRGAKGDNGDNFPTIDEEFCP
jgi:hypothetical protein